VNIDLRSGNNKIGGNFNSELHALQVGIVNQFLDLFLDLRSILYKLISVSTCESFEQFKSAKLH